MITSLVRMTRKIMLGYSDPRPSKEEDEEEKEDEEKPRPCPSPGSWEEEMRNKIRLEERKKLRMEKKKKDEDKKKKNKLKERRREASIQLLNTFIVTIIAGCLGGAIAEMVLDNNNHHKRLFLISTLMFFGSAVSYITLWCFLTLGSRTDNWIIWLTIVSVFALAVPGGALVLGVIATKM